MRAVVVMLFLSVACFSQERYADSHLLFRETMAEGGQIVALMEQNRLEVVKIEMDLVGSAIPPKTTLKYMSSAFTYVLVATGQPSRIQDLDVKVYFLPGAAGEPYFVKGDTLVDNKPAISFQPYTDGIYMIEVIAAKMIAGSEREMGYYFLAIAHN